MRLPHIRRTVALTAAVSATALAAAGPALAHTPVDGPSQYGEWIADVERPAEHYCSRYQLKLDEARSLLARGAELSKAAPRFRQTGAKVERGA